MITHTVGSLTKLLKQWLHSLHAHKLNQQNVLSWPYPVKELAKQITEEVKHLQTLIDTIDALPEGVPCANVAGMGKHACQNAAQCWEPCGQLGHSAEHARVSTRSLQHQDGKGAELETSLSAFESRERDIPQATIAARLVAELRAAIRAKGGVA